MKNSLISIPFLIVLVCLSLGCPRPQQPVDLSWSPTAPVIQPGVTDTLIIEDLGIDDTVYVLQGSLLQSVSKPIDNLSANELNNRTNYNVRVVLEQYAFQAILPSDIKYVPTGNLVVDTLIPGPAPIAARNSAVFTAMLNKQLDCSLYKLSMQIDANGTLQDPNPANNLYEDFIFVPSQQQFNIQLATQEPAQLRESIGPGQLAHTFNILPASPTIANAFYTNLKVQTTQGSTASSVPTPGTDLNPIPANIDVNVDPSIPPVDVIEKMTVKITIISPDGCVLKQKSAEIDILHDE
jgi:hypothetical protein